MLPAASEEPKCNGVKIVGTLERIIGGTSASAQGLGEGRGRGAGLAKLGCTIAFLHILRNALE